MREKSASQGVSRCLLTLTAKGTPTQPQETFYFRLWYVQRAKPSARSLLRGLRGVDAVATAASRVPANPDPMDSEPRMAWAEPALRPAAKPTCAEWDLPLSLACSRFQDGHDVLTGRLGTRDSGSTPAGTQASKSNRCVVWFLPGQAVLEKRYWWSTLQATCRVIADDRLGF